MRSRSTADFGGLVRLLACLVLSCGVLGMPLVRVAHELGVDLTAVGAHAGGSGCEQAAGDAAGADASDSRHHDASSCPICHLLSVRSEAVVADAVVDPCLALVPERPWVEDRQPSSRLDCTIADARAPPAAHPA